MIVRPVSKITEPAFSVSLLTRLYLTELSRQLGFLRFPTIEQSREFVQKNHSGIHFYGPSAGPNDRSTKVRIAYSREREDRGRPKGEDWTCRMVSPYWILLSWSGFK